MTIERFNTLKFFILYTFIHFDNSTQMNMKSCNFQIFDHKV